MKSKKLISFLCALAMTVSSFAGLAVTASAATTDDILWSDTFNSYDLSGISYGTWLDNKLVSGEGSGSKTYSGIDGIVLYTGTKPEGDDSTYWALGSDTDGDKYLVTSTGRFTTVNRGAKLLFGSLDSSDALEATEFAATETKDVVLNLKVKGKAAWESANTYDNAFTIVGKDGTNEVETLFDMTTLGLDLNTWYNVKAVVTTTGTSIYVDDGTNPVATSTAKSITGLKFSVYINGVQGSSGQEYRNSGDAAAGTVAGNGMGYPSYNLDDIVVFNADSGTGATTDVPAAQTHGAAVVAYETVPAGEAPSGLGLVASDDFNSMNSARLVFINTTEADSTYTDLDSVDIFCGTDSSTHSETKWSVTQNAKTDPSLGTEKYLEAASNVKSAANRGPKFYFKRDGAILEVAEREKVVAQFAAKLHNNGDQPAEILFSGDLVASESKGNINSPLALITTDADAASAAYSCDNPLTKNGDNVIEVANNTWVLVEIEAYRSEGKTTGAKIKVTTYTDGEANDPVYILGSASSYGDIKDSTKSGVNNLPYVSFRSGNSTDYYGDGSGSNTTNDIDNIAIYSSTVDPSATPTPTPVPQHKVEITNDGQNVKIESQDTDTTKFDGVLIHVHYDSVTNAPESVKSYPAKNIGKTTDAVTVAVPAGDTIYTGDKLMVWNSLEGMVPYGVSTVQSGETPAVKYAITATNPENGTYTVQVDGVNAASAEAGDEVTITATPAQGYELDTITVKDADNADVTVTAGKFTMPAKAVTVTVTFKALPTPKAITKAAATNGSFTVKAAGAEVESALADTVITVTPTADQDYKVGTVTVAPTDSSVNLAVPVTKNNDGTYTFTMPDVAVTVTVTFVDDSTPADPAITGTVAVTGDPIVGSKLTATVTGLNEGKTAKYQWQANTGDAGAYENIADATANELTIPATLVGKTIKVVVTADGTTGSIASDPTAAVTAPTYTVTGTLGTGVASAVLRPEGATDATKDVAGTVDGTTVTYTVPAGTYTVVATAAADYKNAVSDPATVTVSESATTASFTASATADPSFTITVADNITNGTVTVDKATAKAGAEVTITATPTTLGYELGTITVKDADNGDVTVENNKFTMPAKNVTVTATFEVKANTLVSTASTYLSRNQTSTDDLTTQVSKNYSTDTKVRVGNNGNYNAIGLYQFSTPTIPADKEIASAKLTVVNQGNDNNNGTTTFDVSYPNVSTGIDFSTITWLTMFTQSTVDTATEVPWEHVQTTAPFQSITKLATSPTIPANTPNQTISDIDVTPYVKAQAKTGGPIVLVFNQCSRGANLNKVAIIEYTLQDKHYDVSITAPNADTEGTITVDKANVLPNETVTITTTAVAGKKVTGVTVAKAEGTVETTALTGADAGKYTFTMPAEDVTVSATYDRADIETIEVSGPDTVSTSSSDNTYTAVAKAADGTVLTGVTFAWTVEGASNASGTTITADGGVLTVAADEAGTSGKVTVKATAEGKNGTKEVNVTTAQTYTATKTAEEITGGDIAISPATAIAGATITVTPTAATGYHVTGVTYTDASDAVQNATTADEGATYTFAMPAKNTTVSATFVKTDYTITDGTTEAEKEKGTIAFSKSPANYQDTVEVTVNPGAAYELATLKYKGTAEGSTVAETAITKDAETGKYTFTMPAEAVTVTATFDTKAIADRTPDGASIITYAANATQSLKDNDSKSYTVLSENAKINLSSDLKQPYNKIYTEFDMCLADGDTLKIRGENGGYFSGQLIFVAADGQITVKTNTSSAGDVEYGSTKLETGKWYKVVFNATHTSNAATSAFDWAVYPITITDGVETVGTTATVHQEGMTARNIASREYATIGLEVAGSPKIDNAFVYTDAKYDATVTVTDGTNALEGVTVTLNNAQASTATTDAEGKASFNLVAGEYTATVAKSGYIAPATAPTLTVAKDGANTAAAVMTAKVKTTLTVTAPESKEVIAGDETGITYTAVVKDQEGNAMTDVEAPVTWSVLDSTGTTAISDGTITVSNGKITATDSAVADTYTVKAVAGGSTTDYTDTFTVKKVSPATVTVNYVTTADDASTAIASLTKTINSYVGEALDLADETNAATYLATQTVTDETAGTFKRYTIDSYETNAYKIDELSATNTINVKVSTNDKNYYYFNDFSDLSSDGWSLKVAGRGTVSAATGALVFTGDSSNGTEVNGPAYSISASAYTAEFDFAIVPANNSSQTTRLTLSGTSGTVFEVSAKGGTTSYTVTNATSETKPTVTLESNVLYHAVIVNGETDTLTITKKSDSSSVLAETTIDAGSGINKFTFGQSKAYPGFTIDNIEFYK